MTHFNNKSKINSIAGMLGCPCLGECPRRSPECRSSCVEYFKYELRKAKYYADRNAEAAASTGDSHKRARTTWLRLKQKDYRGKR